MADSHDAPPADPDSTRPQASPVGRWGRLRDPESTAPHGSPDPDIASRTPSGREVVARRRMARGLSTALICLGVLLGASLGASGAPLLAAVGLLPLVAGVLGLLAVALGVPRALRRPTPAARRRGRALWLLGAVPLMLGLVLLAAAFLADASAPESGSPWTAVWLVGAATLVVFSGLAFGLVAVARLTVADDDDAVLRRVDWETEYPDRFGSDRDDDRPVGLYDSSWIRRDSGD